MLRRFLNMNKMKTKILSNHMTGACLPWCSISSSFQNSMKTSGAYTMKLDLLASWVSFNLVNWVMWFVWQIHQPHQPPTTVHNHQITDYEGLIPLTLALYNGTHLSPSSAGLQVTYLSIRFHLPLWISGTLCLLLLDLAGSCWILLDLAGSCWILLDLTGSRWIALDLAGSRWIFLKRIKIGTVILQFDEL